MESSNDSNDASGDGGDGATAVSFADAAWDCDGCPPPFFELPPPPRPPFMDGDFCEDAAQVQVFSSKRGQLYFPRGKVRIGTTMNKGHKGHKG